MHGNKSIGVFTNTNYHLSEIHKHLGKKFQNQRPPSPHSDTYFDTLKFDDFGTVCIYRFLRLSVALA